jgi:hypothetical protein
MEDLALGYITKLWLERCPLHIAKIAEVVMKRRKAV